MKMLNYVFLGLVAIFALSGCTGNYMLKVPENKIKEPESNKATIVFMRSTFVSSALGATLYEVKDEKLSFVGFLPNGTKIAHQTEPGEKVYMAVGYAADFMIANVQAGKTYYVIVRPNWGTGGFAPTPIRTNGTTDYNTTIPEFKKWLEGTALYEVKPVEANTWFEEHKEAYQKIYKEYWIRFQQKSADEIAQRTLTYADAYEVE